ncbi:putative GTP pyrophosphokinase [Bradyrhizobium elkanii]|uniref:GTP pyrophosphokinase n=1 Tax=Bradyrhizobium elkanii TaxID=29448 RepID=UPI00351338B9
MKNSKPRASTLESKYTDRHQTALVPTAEALRLHITDLLRGEPRIDRITARAKDPASFLKKAETLIGGKPKYKDPLSQIQDQLGARIITFFKSDVERIDAIVRSFFEPIEFRDRVPESEWEFGYFGRHYVLIVPTDVKSESIDYKKIPDFFELQIKTLFQHAWSEADHDVGYKPGATPLTSEEKRKLAYTSAQAWGADQIFDELFQVRSHSTH